MNAIAQDVQTIEHLTQLTDQCKYYISIDMQYFLISQN